MNEKKKIVLVDLISALFILLFVYAAMVKLEDFQKFRIELGKSPILSSFPGFFALTVPLMEVIIGLLLMIKRFQYIALYISVSLMVMFSGYILAILKFSSYIPCSCGGIIENMSWGQHLIFNLAFVVFGIIAILLYPYKSRSYLQ